MLGVCRLVFRLGRYSTDPHATARRLLKSLSIKQGLKYDSPESARDIPAFIEFHKLNVDEILRPIEEFSTYRRYSQWSLVLTVFDRDLQSILLPRTETRCTARRVS